MGYNDKNKQVFDTNDISYNISGTETTSGSLVWENGELGQKQIPLVIKPYSGPEIQKIFSITIYDIVGSPATSGHGEVGPIGGSAELTVGVSVIFGNREMLYKSSTGTCSDFI